MAEGSGIGTFIVIILIILGVWFYMNPESFKNILDDIGNKINLGSNSENRTKIGKPTKEILTEFDCVQDIDCNFIEDCKENLCICGNGGVCWK